MDANALGRFAVAWHGIVCAGSERTRPTSEPPHRTRPTSGRRGLEALLDAIEQLQGSAMPASVVEREILPARIADYTPAMLDTLMAAGEVMWVGLEPLGERDGRVALYLTDHLPRLRTPPSLEATIDGRARDVLDYLRRHGASFFADIHQGTGAGFPQETVDALWDLVWKGLVSNDTLHPLRAYVRTEDKRSARRSRPATFRSRRLVPPTAEGRWSVVGPGGRTASPTEYMTSLAQQLLTRHGVVTRETVTHEAVTGGFSTVYQILKAMEDSGRVRRGYFVAGLGGAQFAMPAALDLLRSMRDVPDEPRTTVLSATDPANPYGSILKWPETDGGGDSATSAPEGGRGPTRSVGAVVILVDGAAAGYLKRGERELLLFSPDAEPRRSAVIRQVARTLLHLAAAREEGRRGMLIVEVNDVPATMHGSARLFIEEGFVPTAMGLQARISSSRSGRTAPRPHGDDGTGIAEGFAGGATMPSNQPEHSNQGIPDPEFGTPDSERGTRGAGLDIRDSAAGTRDSGAETPDSGSGSGGAGRANRDSAATRDRLDESGAPDSQRPGESSEVERERVRESNDQQLEREGTQSRRNRGSDEAAHGGRSQDTDPDSPEADVNRDDLIDEP